MKPLSDPSKKGKLFDWSDRCEECFEFMKKRITSAPILQHISYDTNVETRVDTDASDGVTAGVLMQKKLTEEIWHPIGFYSRNMIDAELNYPLQDKEMMAVYDCLMHWRAELLGLPNEFLVLTDHEALKYFATKQHLNGRQFKHSNGLAGFAL